MSSLLIIPVFIPHEGCPHRCLFCNQHRISGQRGSPVTVAEVRQEIQTWLDRRKNSQAAAQVAFYGGSFTALSRVRQEELLYAAAPFLETGQVQSLRLSTRPDCMDAKQSDFLKAHWVATVELGAQSMNDAVLTAARRGHTAADTEQAMAVLKQAGLETGIQLLIGLPGDSRTSLRRTVAQVIALQPDFVRLYPLLVLRGSGLAECQYEPLSLGKAVLLAAFMQEQFEQAGIRTVRMGLQAGPELEDSLLAGPWHPSFGELVKSRLMLRQTRKLLAKAKGDGDPRIYLRISSRDQSVFRGLKSANLNRLCQLGLWQNVVLSTDPEQRRGTVLLLPSP